MNNMAMFISLHPPLSSLKMAVLCWGVPYLRQHCTTRAVSCFTASCAGDKQKGNINWHSLPPHPVRELLLVVGMGARDGHSNMHHT